MGLAVRVIPTLLVRGDQLVKGRSFNSWRPVGHPMQAVKVHNARGVDEIIVLDIEATPNGAGPNLPLIRKLADKCFCPLTVGGGVRTSEQVRDLLMAGVDKIALGDALHGAQHVVSYCTHRYGSQAFVAAIDFFGGNVFLSRGLVRIHDYTLVQWAQHCEALGVGEILLTSIKREGEMFGYDLEAIHEVASAVRIPVIAHGGCGEYVHMVEAIRAGASAVAAGAMFQFTDATPKGAARFLNDNGIEARV